MIGSWGRLSHHWWAIVNGLLGGGVYTEKVGHWERKPLEVFLVLNLFLSHSVCAPPWYLFHHQLETKPHTHWLKPLKPSVKIEFSRFQFVFLRWKADQCSVDFSASLGHSNLTVGFLGNIHVPIQNVKCKKFCVVGKSIFSILFIHKKRHKSDLKRWPSCQEHLLLLLQF